ncbi:MAG: DUF1592 domain-containing protein, partial [Planctomycetes bacterium]|nr:DUF1592 domain-containing protein [Planctomycetota bacterium]
MNNRILAMIIAALSTWTTALHAELPHPFLKTHCIKCHGPQKPKADRRFDQLPLSISSNDQLEVWQEIVDQLNLAAMPPEDEPQPSDAARAVFIAEITHEIAAARARLDNTGGHSVLRRLNGWEYRHTIGDLLGINVEAWNPAADFPAEVKVNGFDNNGSELVTSGMLMDHYLAAAEEIVQRATNFGERPQSHHYKQKSPFYFSGSKGPHKGLPKLFQVDRFRFIPETPYTDLYGRHYRGGHIGFLPLAHGGVPHSGKYTVRVRAAAVDRTHDYGKAIDDFRNGDPLVLALMAVSRVGSVESTGSITDSLPLARVELTNEKPEWFQWDVYLEKGYEVEVRFDNGTQATKRLIRLLMKDADFHEEFKPFRDMKVGAERAHSVLKVYRGPKLRVWEIQVEGPHVESWPPLGHQLVYGDLQAKDLNAKNIPQRLKKFAETAFRRPLERDELAPIEKLVADKLDQTVEPLAALQLGCQAILCSPGFIYRHEGEGPLDDYALASRLSYFLWSSMPDDQLIEIAAANQLHDPAVLRKQVARMLADPKSQRFVRHFVRRWLDLDNIGEMPPSADFTVWYRDDLENAMRGETETFFRHVLDGNLSPREFLAADYSFVNRELALHYGLKDISGSHLRRVSLENTQRGGLLGQGLFLTASANGVDTSPVVRGIYVLEKLLAGEVLEIGVLHPAVPDL